MNNYKELCKCINNEHEQEECLFCRFIKDLKEDMGIYFEDYEEQNVFNAVIDKRAGEELTK